MRRAAQRTAGFAGLSVVLLACGILPDISQNQQADSGSSAATAADAGGDGATWVGQGCGVEQESGLQLCAVTNMCPNVVIDTQVFPHCGFRIRGSAIDLVCGCNGAVCPMGIFTSCTQAAQLLTSQTEQSVCAQVNEGRCTQGSAPTSSSSGANPNCDKQCMTECGGGAACASLCNCG